MTSPMSPDSPVSLEELRRRVREAEGLLGVARGLARIDLQDPGSSDRARKRILSILKEVDDLFPSLGDPVTPVEPEQLIAPSMRAAAARAAATEARELQGGGEADEEAEEEIVWEFDLTKLSRAIENEELMSKIPEVDREWFRGMARRSIEAKERVTLCTRVRDAFDELSREMRAGLDETAQRLAVALTFEQLKAKQRQ